MTTRRVACIAATPDYEVAPDVSHDANWIVYAVEPNPGDQADHIFLRTLDGKIVKQLTAEDASDSDPAFSPDGSLIVFTHRQGHTTGARLAANWDAGVLCVMNETEPACVRSRRMDRSRSPPHFSADGKAILFWNDDGMYTVATDGSQPPSPLGGLDGRDAVYSPDGRFIAFSMGQYAPDLRIFVARADGTALRRLPHPAEGRISPPGGGCSRPVFTPDGKRILFFLELWPDGATGHAKESLWESDIDGGHPREIADFGLFDDPLHWMPGPPIQKRGS